MAFVQITEFDGCQSEKKGKFSKNCKILSESISWIKLLLGVHVYDIGLYIFILFQSDNNWLLWQLIFSIDL